MGIEIIPAAFTDHYAVAIRITVQNTDLQRARVRWKMDPIMINDKHLIKRISSEWVKWQTPKRHYPDITMCWERCVINAFLSSYAKKSKNVSKIIRYWKITSISAYMRFYLVISQNPPNYKHFSAIEPR